MAGVQLKSCPFRKGCFRYPSNEGFSEVGNSSVAEPTIPTASNISGGSKEGIWLNFTKNILPLSWLSVTCQLSKTKVLEKYKKQFSIY